MKKKRLCFDWSAYHSNFHNHCCRLKMKEEKRWRLIKKEEGDIPSPNN
jgi:hypothetical protein